MFVFKNDNTNINIMTLKFLIIFIICLFFYIHIKHQKYCNKDDDIIITQIDSKAQLDELCDYKLPIKFPNTKFTELLGINISLIKNEFNNEHIDFNVCNIQYNKVKTKDVLDFKDFVPLDIDNTIELFSTEDTYITETNYNIMDTILRNQINENDGFFKPPLNIKKYIDLLSGSIEATTYLQHYITNRTFLFVTSGSLKIRFVNPKFSHLFEKDFDYNEYIYKYKDNIWNYTHNDKWNKFKYIEVDAKEGDIIFIPPYWLYSICYGRDCCCISLKYEPLMNMISNMKEHTMSILQKSNTKVIKQLT